MSTNMPLFVDLDGTLIKTDLLYESFLARLKRDPLVMFRAVIWLLRGKAYLKQQLSEGYALVPELLPYDDNVLQWVRSEQESGRVTVLATASHQSLALPVAAYVDCFDHVLASDDQHNLAGLSKLAAIREFTGDQSFAYVGNSGADIPIWNAAQQVVVANPTFAVRRWLVRRSSKDAQLLQGEQPNRLKAMLKALRVHQWLKNILVLVPLLVSHQFNDPHALLGAGMAFLVFGLFASSVYIINDLVDLESDRRHPRKCRRPFASGALPIPVGLLIAPVLLLGAITCATLLLPHRFLLVMLAYLLATTLYSFWLKAKPVIDVILLACLYTVRIVAGTAAIGIAPSFWLLAFSMFIFLGLALVKRYAELDSLARSSQLKAAGRGYHLEDMPILQSMGAASCYLSVLVLALYINSPEVRLLYPAPWVLWLLCPMLLLWITRVWLLTHRGLMHDDPVVFAARDRFSIWLGALSFAVVFMGSKIAKFAFFLHG